MEMGMRGWGSVALFTLLASGQAQAAPPKVQGKYGMISYHTCQTVFQAPKGTADKNNVANAQQVITAFGPLWSAGSNSAGMASISVGTITFPDVASSSGNATITTVEVVGHAQRFPNTGVAADNSGFMRHTTSNSGAFSITAASATLGGKTYDYSFGDVDGSGVAHTINTLRRPSGNEYCLEASTLTKQ